MSELPERLLERVLWSCDKERHADMAALGEAVQRYQADIQGDSDHWEPTARVLEVPRVRVSYMCWDGEEQIDVQLPLEAKDGVGFTALELLFGVCDGIAADMQAHGRELYDHHFFEGLSLGSSEGVPLYFVDFGS